MSFFKSRVSFHLNFASTSWSISLWTKRAHQITNFQIFECFNEISPNSSCQFWNHNVKVYSNFELLFSVTKDNSTVLFYLNPLYLRKKEPIKVKFSDFWVLGWKITKFLMSKLKLQVRFSFLYSSVMQRLLTAHFFDFWLLLLKVYRNFCWKVQISYVSLFWRLMQNLKKNWSVVSSNDKNLVNFDLSTQKSQKFALSLVPIVQSI